MAANYGETTKRFLLHLQESGPQTVHELKKLWFWTGIRTRIPKLIKQGRVERVYVPNPLSHLKYARYVVPAYKIVPGASVTPWKRGRRCCDGETKAEQVKREKKARAVDRAIRLLEEQGYKVMAPPFKALMNGIEG